MDNDKFINHARLSFAILRWGSVVALLALPFMFSEGSAAPTLIVSALTIAVGWLTTLVMAWRTRNQLWFALGFLIVVVAPRFIGLNDPNLPGTHALQWLCYLLIFTGSPLLLLRKNMLEISRLNQKTNTPWDATGDKPTS